MRKLPAVPGGKQKNLVCFQVGVLPCYKLKHIVGTYSDLRTPSSTIIGAPLSSPEPFTFRV
jgi:hypothetical protein